MGFAEEVRLKGHTFQIEKDSGLEKAEGTAKDVEPWVTAKNGARNTRNSPIKMQRQQAIKWISHIQERLRGRELPGVFNPMIIGHLFREQSTNWEPLARKHIDAVANACKRFLLEVLNSIGTPDTKEKLSTLTVLPFMKNAHSAAVAELERVLIDKSRHPITYNHYFTDSIQKLQQEHLTKALMDNANSSAVTVKLKTFPEGKATVDKEYIDPLLLKRGIEQSIEHDMNKVAAGQALDAHDAFYKVISVHNVASLEDL
jgi:hypothetical protein